MDCCFHGLFFPDVMPLLKSNFTLPGFSRFSRRVGAWLRPRGEVRLSGNGVQLRVGRQSFSAPLEADLAPAQESARVVAALLGLLAEPSVARLGRLHLVASDRWLRPLVFPVGEEQLSDEDIEALVEHQYRQLFGKLMAGWAWRWDRQGNGQVVAMAWPDQLVDLLRAKLAEQGIRLVSALPLSLHAMKAVQRPADPAWFVVAEAGCATFVRLEKDGWRHWRVYALPEMTAERVMLQFMRMVAQLEDGCRSVWVLEADSACPWAKQLRTDLAGAGWGARMSGAAP